jgi:hypothetical protein
MAKFIHKIWITALTLMALVLSSVVSGASSNPEWADVGSMPSSQESVFSHPSSTCDTEQHTAQVSSSHHCCSSMCVMNLPVASPLDKLALQPQSLALIGGERHLKTVSLSNGLYRPPILNS